MTQLVNAEVKSGKVSNIVCFVFGWPRTRNIRLRGPHWHFILHPRPLQVDF